ncbi:unnamed protein product, partial [Mesorhabditis belari]|uniref:SUZ domain-containing protein n=1 Tax=Mesorhabditis belari TaxID=2138241 RepID=A0AAF3J7S6_9BILA
MSAETGQNAAIDVIDNWEDDPEQAVQMVEQKMKQVKLLKRNEEDRKAMAQKRMQEEEARKELEELEKEKRTAMGISQTDEASTAEEPPIQVKLLKRPNGGGGFNTANGRKHEEAKPRKTLEERQAAYDEARNRILGEGYKFEEEAASAPVVEAPKPTRSKSPEIIRVSRNPPLVNQPPSLMNTVFAPPVHPIHVQHGPPPFYPMQMPSHQPPAFVQPVFPGVSAFAAPLYNDHMEQNRVSGSTSPPQEYTTHFDEFIASQGTGRPLLYFDPSRPPPPLVSQVNPRMVHEGRQTVFYTGRMPQQPPPSILQQPPISSQSFRPAPQQMVYSDQIQIKNLNCASQSNNNLTKRKSKGKKGAKPDSLEKS